MTLNEFVKTYNGKQVDYDGVYGSQCVDLFREYVKVCLGIKEHTGVCKTTGGAKDLYLDFPVMPIEQKYFKRSYSEKYIAGDILIWGNSETNKYGHVAIYLGKLGEDFIVFEQNGFKQDGAKINLRSKKNLLGFLRKKGV